MQFSSEVLSVQGRSRFFRVEFKILLSTPFLTPN